MSEPINSDLLSQLSKLATTDEEEKTIEKNLVSILEYVGTLQKVDTSEVPLRHRQALTDETLRADVVIASDEEARKIIIANFPHAKNDLLEAPEVFE